MSFKGEIEAQCPDGCEPFTTDVWSFINGEKRDDLRLAVMFRECNMILCPQCQKPFFAQAPFVYLDSRLELLAFVFPESYKDKEDYWRKKMKDDFGVFRANLKELPLDIEPELFFGVEGLAALLEGEEYRGEEREVMEFVARDLKLSLYEVSPLYARRQGIPATLPYSGKSATRENVIDGLERVVAANDRLTAFADYLGSFRSSGAALPPASTAKR
jgi:hypothetical protein